MTTTTKAAHTPGPWDCFVGNADGRGLIRIEQYGTGQHIASMQRGAVSEANARLIAAAPDLLEAMQACVRSYEEHRDQQPTGHLWPDPNHIFQARNAIAKALNAA